MAEAFNYHANITAADGLHVPKVHSASHEDGGTDELDVSTLPFDSAASSDIKTYIDSQIAGENHWDTSSGNILVPHIANSGIDLGSGSFTTTGNISGQKLTSVGRVKSTTRVTTTPYTILASDEIISVDTDAEAITVNLPAGVDGTTYKIINSGTSGNNITLVPNGAELLNGSNANETIYDNENFILTYETTEGWW